MRRAAWLVAALMCAGCIDKPLKPSERPPPDGGPGEVDGNTGCDDPPDDRTAWQADDKIRFDQVVAQLNGDCFDDLLVPGSLGSATEGVFVILGRSSDDFFVGGYDQFVATTDSEPLRVAATDLVGEPPLDLVVFARSIDDGQGEVRVFEGVGDGSFLAGAISRLIAGSDFPSPPVDASGRFTLEPMHAADSQKVDLLVGDADEAHVIVPVRWTQEGLDDAQVVPAFADTGTQGAMVVPSGREGLDDLVQVDFATWEWFVNSAALEFTSGNVALLLDDGPRTLRPPDPLASTDIASVSVQGQNVSFLFVQPPAGPDDAGAIAVKGFAESPVDAADGIDAVELIGLGGGSAPELLVLDAGDAAEGATLWLFHDLEDGGATVTPANQGEFGVAEFDADHPYNRMALGAFRVPGRIELYVFSGSPALTRPICWLPDPETGDLVGCD